MENIVIFAFKMMKIKPFLRFLVGVYLIGLCGSKTNTCVLLVADWLVLLRSDWLLSIRICRRIRRIEIHGKSDVFTTN